MKPCFVSTLPAAAVCLAAVIALFPPAVVAVDWGSLFHGSAAPPKSPPPQQRARIAWGAGVKADAAIEAFLSALADALMARDGQRMQPHVSNKYTIAGLPASEDPRKVFAQAIERIPGPRDMEITALSQEKDGDRLATVEFRYPNAPAKTRRIRVDAEGKLVASDLFNIRVEQH